MPSSFPASAPAAALVTPLLSLLVVLLALGALTAAATVVFMAQALLRPPRMSDGKALYLLRRLAPDDLGLAYERAEPHRPRRAHRPAALPGGLVGPGRPTRRAADAGRCAVLIHGYADAKVGAIAWAPVWHALGYHLLVPDLRAHGESGGPGHDGRVFRAARPGAGRQPDCGVSRPAETRPGRVVRREPAARRWRPRRRRPGAGRRVGGGAGEPVCRLPHRRLGPHGPPRACPAA